MGNLRLKPLNKRLTRSQRLRRCARLHRRLHGELERLLDAQATPHLKLKD